MAGETVESSNAEHAVAAMVAGHAANQAALKRIKVRAIGVRKANADTGITPDVPAGASKILPEDPFQVLASEGKIIEPPFDLLTLAMLPEHSSELGQCIEAMMVNIEGFGHRQKCRIMMGKGSSVATDTDTVPPNIRAEVLAERVRLANFFEYATEESFVEFRKKLRKDEESTGNAFFEVIRNASGVIQGFKHIPAYQMRLGKQDDELVEYERSIMELQVDGSVEIKKVKTWRRFRRFVQSTAIHRRNLTLLGYNKRWFKSFGDPRDLHMDTGEYGTADVLIPVEKRANEVVHIKLYCTRSPYGIPRYVGNMLSIFGDRAAEEINYITFRNNNIPSMVVLVSNGQLTEESIARIESFVESQIQGSDNYSKFLIVEGESTADEGEDGGQVKVSIQPLVKEQHTDAMFQNYSDKNHDKIRRAYRLPPIFVGQTEDYTRATADSSRRLADEQVFAPERDEFDSLVNREIYPDMGIRYHKYKSNSPNTTDNEQLVKILGGAEKTGGMTPRIARYVLGDILSQDIQDDFPVGFPADVPFSLTMAEAVKNQADASEPGQQVTALKVFKTLQGDAVPDAITGDPLLDQLLAVQKVLEEDWERTGQESSPEHDQEA